MSGTLNRIYNNAGFALTRQSETLVRLQEQAATGSRVNRPSDAPSDAFRILGLDIQKRSLENYIGTISNLYDILQTSTTAIGNMMETYEKTRAQLASVTETDGFIGEAIHAGIIDGYLEDVVLFANWDHSGQYLFGGGDTDSAPFVVERTNGKITNVTYQGSYENRDVEVASGVESSAFYVGDDIFRSDERQAPQFLLGTTGVEAGTGTSSVTGYVWLEITQPGGAGNPYKLSIDGGSSYATTANPPTDTNLAVTHSQTGQVLYVDATTITGTGDDLVKVPGTHDVFNTLITIRDMLENERGLNSYQLKTLKNDLIQTADTMHSLLVQSSVTTGVKSGMLDNLRNNMGEIKLNTEDEKTRLEEADISQIAIELSRHEVLYEMSLAVVGKILSLSLLDFIS